jgi:hypothetical protein
MRNKIKFKKNGGDKTGLRMLLLHLVVRYYGPSITSIHQLERHIQFVKTYQHRLINKL